VVAAADYLEAATLLRDAPGCRFEQLIDLCGVDYSDYATASGRPALLRRRRTCCRSASTSACASRCSAPDDDLPVVDSLSGVWNSANWFEREAFDLYGIVFEGHDDLRRILTDYGFIGHPFRKDFPVSGHVEMRYDPEQKRVIYQPVTIEPREITPRVIREDNYGGGSQTSRGLADTWLKSRTTPSTSVRSIPQRTACCAWCWSSTAK
jgi:NADH-quinone oxidoreductase subunit C